MSYAVIFDLDGVITDTARYHYQAWKKMAAEEGMDFDEEFNEKLKGIDRLGSLELILKHNHRSLDEKAMHLLADRKNGYYKEMIEDMNASDLLPGAGETLAALRANHVKTALASASRNAPTIIAKLGIGNQFDYVVDAGLITRGKPDPEIYVTAADKLGVDCALCIGVEDAVAGVEAIKAAGMYAIGVGDPAVLTQADKVIADLKSFPVEAATKGSLIKSGV